MVNAVSYFLDTFLRIEVSASAAEITPFRTFFY
mgnify:CR=1 FL=1